MLEVQQLFRKHFGHPPTYTVQAPGRIELLGNHTDYNQGLVLALAVDRHVFMSVSSRTDGRVELVSSAFPAPEIFSVLEVKKNPDAPWADYVKGVLAELRKRNAHCSGFNAAIHGTIPPGAGLSSSAALEVATALAVRQLHPYTLTPTGTTVPPQRAGNGALPPLTKVEKLEIAKTCLAAESGFVGVNCGLLDQTSSLFGKAFHAVEIDCQSLAVEHVPMIGEIALVVCQSGVSHALVSGEYNELRLHCEALNAELAVLCDETMAQGGSVSVAVRPEKITISRAAPDPKDRNVVKGIVRDLGYFGESSLYRVRLQNGTVLQVSAQNLKRAARPTVEWDDEVYLSWEVSSTILLRA